jgi:hypothetical protein
VRGALEKSGARFPQSSPRGAKPKGGAGGCRAKPPYGRKAILAGVDPETEACRAGLTLRRRQYRYANGTWVLRGRKAGDTCGEREPPKGESQERRRCETKPARDSREQAVKRVAKP